VDLATADAATRAIAAQLGGQLTLISSTDIAELRSLLAALALGMSADDFDELLSPSLSKWLGEVRREHSEALRAAHLLDVLRSMLGLQTSAGDVDELDERVLRRVARFVGASEVNMPRRPFHVWMPSMTPGLLKRIKAERA
jgi:hypothetical protein